MSNKGDSVVQLVLKLATSLLLRKFIPSHAETELSVSMPGENVLAGLAHSRVS